MALRRPGMQTRSVMARSRCPACGKKGVGNVSHARGLPTRNCRYCEFRTTYRDGQWTQPLFDQEGGAA